MQPLPPFKCSHSNHPQWLRLRPSGRNRPAPSCTHACQVMGQCDLLSARFIPVLLERGRRARRERGSLE